MKKIISILGLISVLSVLAAPLMASAATEAATSCVLKYDLTSIDPLCTKSSPSNPTYTLLTEKGMCCVMNSIYNVTDWIFLILAGIAVIMVLFGAFELLTAGGNADKVGTGRKYIIFAAVGLVAAFLAKAIPGVVKVIVGF